MLLGLSHGALVGSQINKHAADAVRIVFAPRINLFPLRRAREILLCQEPSALDVSKDFFSFFLNHF